MVILVLFAVFRLRQRVMVVLTRNRTALEMLGRLITYGERLLDTGCYNFVGINPTANESRGRRLPMYFSFAVHHTFVPVHARLRRYMTKGQNSPGVSFNNVALLIQLVF